ncbi:MAG: DUF1634 domain-containing protein [Pseudomonadota bacterium]
MSVQQNSSLKPMPEQITYANILFVGAWGGIFLMAITYFIYLANILPPHVDISVVIQNWDKGVDEFMKITNSPHGWGWATMLNKGDFLNYLGMAMIALLTIVCYIVLLIGYHSRKDWIYFTICIMEVLVLSLAASGILGSGGH